MILEAESQPKDFYEKNSEQAANRRTRLQNPTPYSRLGKLPPQATDLEELVLGAILLEREAFLNVSEFLKAEHFYRDNHQKIFNAISEMFAAGDPIDIGTITARLRKNGELEIIGGAYYITELTDRVASSANIEFHARVILQKHLQRELIRISTIVINHAYEDTTDVLELLEANQVALFNLAEFNHGQHSEKIDALVNESVVTMNTPVPNGLTGVGTGFPDIDRFTAGWQKGHLIIIGARPGMGKTSLMLQFAMNAACLHSVPTGIFSLEMSRQQLTNRMISNETEIFLEKIAKRELTELDKKIIGEKLGNLRNAPLHIDDTPGLTLVQFRSKAIRMKRLYDIQFILVDYLQLMEGNSEGKNGNREQELSKISRGLKKIAKELGLPIMALSQLSRGVEERKGGMKRPMLSDLRESGAIEQDADSVLFIFRPEYYGITKDENNNSTAQMAEIIWAKHRDGPTDTLKLKFRAAVMRFETWKDGESHHVGEAPVIAEQTNMFTVPAGDSEDELPF